MVSEPFSSCFNLVSPRLRKCWCLIGEFKLHHMIYLTEILMTISFKNSITAFISIYFGKIMKHIILIALSLASLTGCMSVKQIPGPNGERMVSVTCNGTIRNWGDCLEAVAETCGSSGYDVVQRNGESYSTGSAYISGDSGWANETAGFNRNMVAVCKP